MSLQHLVNKFQLLETPFYYYDIQLLRDTLDTIKRISTKNQFKVHYALKANVNRRLLSEIKNYNLGADCVSGNEVKRAIELGFEPDEIVFAGVGKSDNEIKIGFENDIFAFNAESIEELHVLESIAGQMGKKSRFALRINPNVDAGTHEYITTGTRDNKFGITLNELLEAIPLIRSLKNLEFIGLHFHIGSQITDISKFETLSLKINDIQKMLVENGFTLPHINVGGGLGINYEDPDNHSIADFESYFGMFRKHLKLPPGQSLHFELGRSIVGQCGSLISRVLFTKPGQGTTFMILDAGMTELIRPALYKTPHFIQSITSTSESEVYDVVGPICETTDCFARGLLLPKSKRGDLIAIRSAGAYAEVMSSRYNLREVAPSIFSDELS